MLFVLCACNCSCDAKVENLLLQEAESAEKEARVHDMELEDVIVDMKPLIEGFMLSTSGCSGVLTHPTVLVLVQGRKGEPGSSLRRGGGGVFLPNSVCYKGFSQCW